MLKTNKKVTAVYLFMIYLAVFVTSSSAQANCDIKSFRLNKIQGKIVSNGPKGYEPIPQAKIELWLIGKADEEDSLAESTLSDENGYFEISKINLGFYRLEVSKYNDGFMKHISGIKISKKFKKSARNKQLLIRLGVSMFSEGCGNAVLTNIDKS